MLDTIKNYATQKSTYLGLFKIAAAVGLFTLAPDLQDGLADAAVKISEGLLFAIGAYFTLKNDRA